MELAPSILGGTGFNPQFWALEVSLHNARLLQRNKLKLHWSAPCQHVSGRCTPLLGEILCIFLVLQNLSLGLHCHQICWSFKPFPFISADRVLNLNCFVYFGKPLHFSFFESTFQQNIWWLSQKPSSCWIHLSLSSVLLESFFLPLTSQPLSFVFLPCPSTWPCKGTWARFSPRTFRWCVCSLYISFVCFRWSLNDVIPHTRCSLRWKMCPVICFST